MTKFDLEKGFISQFELILMILLINFLKDHITNYISAIVKNINNMYNSRYYNIEIFGWENILNGIYSYEYPLNMSAINHYIFSNKKSTNFKYFNSKKNGIYYCENVIIDIDHTPHYNLNDVYEIEIYDDIYITVKTEEIPTEKKSFNWKIIMNIKTYKHDLKYIQNFIDKCIFQYDAFITSKTKNKLYHFIYQEKNDKELVFNTNILSDLSDKENQNYETFDNTFHSNKEMLIQDIKRLRDIDYYKRLGLKRKKGYLFYGKPGTGKTLSVINMSNYDNRHIIEVPMSKIKTNSELEEILTIKNINNIKFKPNNIIILFDELDINTNLERNRDENKNNEKVMVVQKDKLCLSTLLSRLDGIGNYGGLIIVGTTNNIDKIDKSLYRDGRLGLVHFDYATSTDIINIIKKYYQVKHINTDLINRINKLDKKISQAKIRCKLEQYNNIDELISCLEDIAKIIII
jgi:ATP-dependent 26S proteasome regulatory subunit